MNKHEVRDFEFNMQREWAERFDSDALLRMLADKRLPAGQATAAREVLRARGESLGLPDTNQAGGG
jgi:hypothetical protein